MTANATSVAGTPAATSPDARDTALGHLHPIVRAAATRVIAALNAEGYPFALFEGFRTPARQAHLYAQGRTRPGAIVTKAQPWSSYHQYGLAVDLVLRIGGQWSWDDSGARAAAWSRMNAIGLDEGLEPLSWERPHLQLAGTTTARLQNGDFPAGDDSWADNLEAAIAGWSGPPPAPALPAFLPQRPAIPVDPADEAGTNSLLANASPKIAASGWHGAFGGQEWRYDNKGVYLRTVNGGTTPLRTPGAPMTMRAIWEAFGTLIQLNARRFGVPPEIIMMTIATEAAAYRRDGFTGPATFRWESHVWNRDVTPNVQGDYSAGPMQTLGTTARWVIGAQGLGHHPFQVAPVYTLRPQTAPATHPLYEADTNIEIGTAEISQRLGMTGLDPVLVAAAYNSGGVYATDANAWHLRSHGNHLDRAAQWFGDACFVLAEAGLG